MENSTTIEMEPVGSGANTSSPETGQQNISCFKIMVQKVKALVKLGIAIWVFGDIVSDALQTKKYHNQSPYWNPGWNSKITGTNCSEVDLDFEIQIPVEPTLNPPKNRLFGQ